MGGRLASITTAGNPVTAYTYEARNLLPRRSNRLARRRLLPSTTPVGSPAPSIRRGRSITLTTTPTGFSPSADGAAISRQYDAAGRLTQFTDAQGNVLKYAYDAVGNLITLTYPDGKQVSYAYDQANRLIQVTDWANRITSYTYDPDGRLATTTRPNGTVETRTWDEAGQLAQISDVKGGTVIAQFTLIYDPAGRIVAEHPSAGPRCLHACLLYGGVRYG